MAAACNVPVEHQRLFPLSRRSQRFQFRPALLLSSADSLGELSSYVVGPFSLPYLSQPDHQRTVNWRIFLDDARTSGSEFSSTRASSLSLPLSPSPSPSFSLSPLVSVLSACFSCSLLSDFSILISVYVPLSEFIDLALIKARPPCVFEVIRPGQRQCDIPAACRCRRR